MTVSTRTFGRVEALEAMVVNAAADVDFSVVVLRDGRLVAWGANNCGQLGCEAGPPRTRPRVSVLVCAGDAAGAAKAVSASAGGAHVLTLTRTGSVIAFGDAQYGERGDGTSGGFSAIPCLARCQPSP